MRDILSLELRKKWEKIVKEYVSSGEHNKIEYCRKNKIGYSTFKYWYRRLQDSNGKESITKKEEHLRTRDEKFIELKLVNTTATKINLPNGITVETNNQDVVELIKGLYVV